MLFRGIYPEVLSFGKKIGTEPQRQGDGKLEGYSGPAGDEDTRQVRSINAWMQTEPQKKGGRRVGGGVEITLRTLPVWTGH